MKKLFLCMLSSSFLSSSSLLLSATPLNLHLTASDNWQGTVQCKVSLSNNARGNHSFSCESDGLKIQGTLSQIGNEEWLLSCQMYSSKLLLATPQVIITLGKPATLGLTPSPESNRHFSIVALLSSE
jgi:hypothetical protein